MEQIFVAILCLIVLCYFVVDSRFRGIAKQIDACNENYEYLIIRSKVVSDTCIPINNDIKLPNDIVHECVID